MHKKLLAFIIIQSTFLFSGNDIDSQCPERPCTDKEIYERVFNTSTNPYERFSYTDIDPERQRTIDSMLEKYPALIAFSPTEFPGMYFADSELTQKETSNTTSNQQNLPVEPRRTTSESVDRKQT